jgi:hypothetical protein
MSMVVFDEQKGLSYKKDCMTAEKSFVLCESLCRGKNPRQGNKVPSYANHFAEEKIPDKGIKFRLMRITLPRKKSQTRE